MTYKLAVDFIHKLMKSVEDESSSQSQESAVALAKLKPGMLFTAWYKEYVFHNCELPGIYKHILMLSPLLLYEKQDARNFIAMQNSAL
jgi:hypothetical protein